MRQLKCHRRANHEGCDASWYKALATSNGAIICCGCDYPINLSEVQEGDWVTRELAKNQPGFAYQTVIKFWETESEARAYAETVEFCTFVQLDWYTWHLIQSHQACLEL